MLDPRVWSAPIPHLAEPSLSESSASAPQRRFAGPESASHPDSLTLPPTKCLHSPPYDRPKMDKSSTPGTGGGDQATSGEPQYIRARVQSACDGCKARKGRQLPLCLSCHWPVPPDLRLWFHSICVDGCTLSALPVHWAVAMCARCYSAYFVSLLLLTRLLFNGVQLLNRLHCPALGRQLC